jgi:ribulose-bisphosphate carboxylase large chain
MKIFNEFVDKNKYFIVKYFLEASKGYTIKEVAWALAIGQSVGNPNVRNRWETDELFENHSCIILANENSLNRTKGIVEIAFPVVNINFNTDGITQMLVQIMGGQLDIDVVKKCQILDIYFPKSVEQCFLGPKYGIKGIRDFTNTYDKPLLGSIIKPKIGISPKILLRMVEELVEGGVNFIKEDEIMSNPLFCTIEDRVPLVMDFLKDKNVIYAVSITSDTPYLLNRVQQVYELGANAVHVNFWSGLGTYNSIRKMDLPLFLFFQKSGDKILTNETHHFHIKWDVICKLAGMMGVDFIHAGMWGGYLSDNEENLRKTHEILYKYDVMPSLSCGMHAGLIEAINTRFGFDYMANVGGAIHGHPGGSKAGAMALRQSIDKKYGKEYRQSINKWGLVE